MGALQSKAFWGDAFERAVRTMAQGFLSVLTLDGANVLTLNWVQMLGVGLTAGAISILMSIVASGSGTAGSASFVE